MVICLRLIRAPSPVGSSIFQQCDRLATLKTKCGAKHELRNGEACLAANMILRLRIFFDADGREHLREGIRKWGCS